MSPLPGVEAVEVHCCRPLQVEARGLKPNTVFYYQWRYRQNNRAEPVRTVPTQKRFDNPAHPDAPAACIFLMCMPLPPHTLRCPVHLT